MKNYFTFLAMPPQWLIDPVDMEGLQGRSLTLNCEAYGSPDPEVEFIKLSDDETENEENGHLITYDNSLYRTDGAKLIIK